MLPAFRKYRPCGSDRASSFPPQTDNASSKLRPFLFQLFPIIVLLIALVHYVHSQVPRAPLQTFEGQVVNLAEIIKTQSAQVDVDAAPFALALRTADGKLLPIVKTLGSRALFQDARLLNRPVQVQAQLVPGSQVLVVHRVYTVKNGVPHEVYYWCETCAIRRDYPDKGICECCGAPMELREVPLK
ncbi:MAG: hypothetical protein RMI91_08330 [Gemmatales bacterium]|nr:hypothetical protein [Gemmatales bacterium]MDW7994648.1 hypothetical protein [Gemmatales bacterium]